LPRKAGGKKRKKKEKRQYDLPSTQTGHLRRLILKEGRKYAIDKSKTQLAFSAGSMHNMYKGH
jgi:hypothetical protein